MNRGWDEIDSRPSVSEGRTTGGFSNILSLPISKLSMDEVVRLMERTIADSRKCTVFPVNVDVVMKSLKDDTFRKVLCEATLLTPDGMPIVWASKFLGNPVAQKVTGSVLFEAFCRSTEDRGHRLFFLGGEEGVAAKAARVLEAKYPALRIAGWYSPPWNFEQDALENRKIVDLINSAKPDILVVGLGAPKQEKWITKHKDLLTAKVFLAVGGTFDFYSGKIKKAPEVVSKIGLEWCWRIFQDPKRLWKRYLIDDPPFFIHLLRQKWRADST